MTPLEEGERETPSWTLLSIRSAFLRAAAERMARRASQLTELGAEVKPLKESRSISRLDLRDRKKPSLVWGHLDDLESNMREYDAYLDSCAQNLALYHSKSRSPSAGNALYRRPGK